MGYEEYVAQILIGLCKTFRIMTISTLFNEAKGASLRKIKSGGIEEEIVPIIVGAYNIDLAFDMDWHFTIQTKVFEDFYKRNCPVDQAIKYLTDEIKEKFINYFLIK